VTRARAHSGVADWEILACFAREKGENRMAYLLDVGRALLELGARAASAGAGTVPAPGIARPLLAEADLPKLPKPYWSGVDIHAHREVFTREQVLEYTLGALNAAAPGSLGVVAATDSLVDALAASKGWLRDYARAVVEDAVDRVQQSTVTLSARERDALIRIEGWLPGGAGTAEAAASAEVLGVLMSLAARLKRDTEELEPATD
jgi:hypothetical protein